MPVLLCAQAACYSQTMEQSLFGPVGFQPEYMERTIGPELDERASFREWFYGTRLGRMATGAACALGLIGGAGIEATPAVADASVVHRVYRTGDGLFLHTDDRPALRGSLGDLMPDGAEFDVQCWKLGDQVNGNPVWLEGTNKTTGHEGVAADYYIDTHWKTTADLTAQGMPPCDGPQTFPATSPAVTPNSPKPWEIPVTSIHDRVDHVVWSDTPFGKSLHVYVTRAGYVTSFAFAGAAFNEVMYDAHIPYSAGLYNQFACHAYIAPPWKSSWNLDMWRPDVGLAKTIEDECNPQPGERS